MPECDAAGSPQKIQIDSPDRLQPGDSFDALVDSMSSVNQGAANVFRFDPSSGSFDRIATSFTDQARGRIGGSQVEPRLIVAGHPAHANLATASPYIGEVPVAERMRFAYLMPILDADAALIGVLAVDIGLVDDLNRIDARVVNRVAVAVLVLLGAMAVAGIIAMFLASRPLNPLIKVAHDVGSNDDPDTVQLTERRDEIGYLAQGLAKQGG